MLRRLVSTGEFSRIKLLDR